MGERFAIHPVTPQARLVARSAEVLGNHGVVVIPTDTCYAFVTSPGSRSALERIAQIKALHPDKKLFSLIVPDLSDIARYALVDTSAYRILKHYLPGPYTFVLPATREVPRILLAKRKTIGLRVPDSAVCRAVATAAGGALLATTVRLPGDDLPLADPDEIEQRIGHAIDLFLDGGWGGVEPSTVVALADGSVEVIREGAGDPAPFA